jgi:hypothetical protein
MPDAVYFAQRAEESRAAMLAATDEGARLAHRQLQCAYEALAAAAARHESPALFTRPGYAPRHDPAPRAPAFAVDLSQGEGSRLRDDKNGVAR